MGHKIFVSYIWTDDTVQIIIFIIIIYFLKFY